MKPKMIGIVGGAGPLAGASLLERVLSLAGSTYGCYRDSDYPEILLLSYPFSEMLTEDLDAELVRNELKDCLNKLRKCGAEVIAIACNTLHAFLDKDEDLSDIVHLPQVLTKKIPQSEMPLVLCTTTSARCGLHKQFFPCVYPDLKTQFKIDSIIDRILKSENEEAIFQDLITIMQEQVSNTIILGCTELSLYTKRMGFLNKTIIDPLDAVADELLEISFSKIKGEKICCQ